jgi:lysophospholipase L1-like esterase
MTKPGPSVTSGADTQPGSDSLFPSGFGGGAIVRTGGVGTSEIADSSVAATDLNLPSVSAALAARSEFTGTYATPGEGRTRSLILPAVVRETVTADQPTITVTSSSSSGITSGVFRQYPHASIAYYGAVPTLRGGGAPFLYDHFPYSGPAFAETMHYGTQIAALVATTNPGSIRFRVDDQYVAIAPTTDATSATYRTYLLTFGARRLRKITAEVQGMSFGGFSTGPNDSVWAPRPRRVRALFIGDSLTNNTNTTAAELAYHQHVARQLGWEEPVPAGISGSGYLASGSGTPFSSRIATYMALNPAPDAYVVFGGINDRPTNNAAYTASALQTAATSLFQTIVTSAPNASDGRRPRLYVLGCWQPSGSPVADITAANTAIQAAAAAVSGVTAFIDLTGLITGTGRVGTTTGSGNADLAISSDALHPTDEGHALLGGWVATKIAATLPAVA